MNYENGDIKARLITPFFSSAFSAFEKCENSFSLTYPFGLFWSAKYLNFGAESCEVRVLSY